MKAAILLSFALAGAPLTASANVITDWDDIAVRTIQPVGPVQPIGVDLTFRASALVEVAMFNAVNCIEPKYHAYGVQVEPSPDTSQDAAAATAAATVLIKLVPNSNVKQQLADYLAKIPDGPSKDRGIKVSETRRGQQGIYEGYIKITVTTGSGSGRRVAGTVFSDGRPRLIQIKDINLEAEFAPHMLYVVNEDKPGFIGKFGTVLGDAKVNIANFTLGRSGPGQDAIALIEVDGVVPDAVVAQVTKLPLVKMAKALAF